MIGKRAETVLNRAVQRAVENGHEYFTLEHVLWALLAESDVEDTIRACGGDPANVRRAVEEYLRDDVPPATPKENAEPGLESPVATLGIQRLMQRALFQVQSAGKGEIQPLDLFVALFQAKDSRAAYLLSREGVERLDVLGYVSHGLGAKNEEGAAESEEAADDGAPGGQPQSDETALATYATDLNERAREGKLDPLVGRETEVERIVQILCRRRKNNPLLVGEAGVGKTALAEGLAQRIVAGEVPEPLRDAVVYSLDLGALIAGAKFRGDFENRLKRVIASLEKKREKGEQPVLFIDEIHTIVGAGATSGGALDAANLIKPLLTRGEIHCIGSTTYAEYRGTFEKDHALARRFQKVDVPEPTIEETVRILNGLKSRFEAHHGVSYAPEALRAAAELSSKHLNERFLPDKAIDVLDEAGARARLARTKNAAESTVIGVKEIEEVVALIARIPARSVSGDQKQRLKTLDRDLRLSIFGQDHAVDALVTAIRLARSGLRTGERPVGCFLFAGPTGVGKTELSKQLAHCLGVPFLRFDMSEYGEKHTVSRLIGAPPGYVGFEQAGLLTDAVLKNPYSVILLDEIEKAHADVWNILLQIMDHGTLTDNNGRKADFRNAILILTSNVGSRELERKPLGLTSEGPAGEKGAQKAVERTFTPEFRNRLDAIVHFNPLSPAAVSQVVDKQLLELESQLLSKGVEVDFSQGARDWLATRGYDRQMGARPLARLIQDKLKRPLSEQILFGALEQGGSVHVTMKGPAGAEEPALEIVAKDEQAVKKPASSRSSSKASKETQRG